MALVTQNFVCSGVPGYIIAISGVQAKDISTGIIYQQTTVPYGSSWRELSKGNIFIPAGGGGGVTSVGATAPVVSSGGATPVISMPAAGAGQSGYLTSADWNTFNSKVTTPLTTKGDIYVRDASVDTRLPVGLDTQVLLADSSTPTGLKWGNTTPTPLGYYGAFSDTTDQFATVPFADYTMLLGITDLSNGVTITSGSKITIANTGIYDIQWSAQFVNQDSAEHDVTVWLRRNGANIPGTSGVVSVPKRRGSINGHALPSWNFLIDPVAGDTYEFVWSTTDIAVYIAYLTGAFPAPTVASVVVTVTQQSGIMAGTGITAINSLTGGAQTLIAGTSGTDFAINSAGIAHTFNLPTASAVNRGALSSADWTTFDNKQNALGFTPENVANKATSLTSPDNTKYPTTLAVSTAIAAIPAGITVNKTMAYIAAY
jgi:hypothetical protein